MGSCLLQTDPGRYRSIALSGRLGYALSRRHRQGRNWPAWRSPCTIRANTSSPPPPREGIGKWKTKSLSHYVVAGLLSIAVPLASAAEQEVSAPEVVGAIEGAFGVNKGERRNHIKGVCALGEFVGTKEAAAYSRSELFSGKPIPGRRPFLGDRRQSQGAGYGEERPRHGAAIPVAQRCRAPDGDAQHADVRRRQSADLPRPDAGAAARSGDRQARPGKDEGLQGQPSRTTSRNPSTWPPTIRRSAMPTAPSGASTPSSSSARATRRRWCAGASCRRMARSA